MRKNIFSKLKSVLASAAAVVMAVGLTVAPVAAETTSGTSATVKGKITINQAQNGQTYTIYKVLDLESYDQTSGAYSYKIPTAWSNFFATGGAGNAYLSTNDAGYVTVGTLSTSTVKDFVAAAKTYAETNYLTNQGTKTATSSGTVTFDNLDLGYYLVDTTTGALASIDTTDNEAEIDEKNGVPSLEKTVQEDSMVTGSGSEGDGTTGYQKKDDADIGQNVYYKTVVSAKAGASNYVVYDTMNGLTLAANGAFVDSIKAGDTTLTENTDYTVTQSVTAATASTPVQSKFEIHFTKTYLDTITTDTDITILYHATLDASAVIGGEGNLNETYLHYGEGTGTDTAHKTTKTYTWPVNVYKYTADTAGTETPVAGAVFKLSTDAAGSDVINFEKTADNTYRKNATGTVNQVTTDSTGKFVFNGLDEGTYYLTEVTAPTGYNKLTAPIKVTVTSDTANDAVETGNKTVTIKYIANDAAAGTTETTASTDGVKVLNNKGSKLPATGGMGTTIFYIIGAALIATAAALLVVKKRRNA